VINKFDLNPPVRIGSKPTRVVWVRWGPSWSSEACTRSGHCHTVFWNPEEKN